VAGDERAGVPSAGACVAAARGRALVGVRRAGGHWDDEGLRDPTVADRWVDGREEEGSAGVGAREVVDGRVVADDRSAVGAPAGPGELAAAAIQAEAGGRGVAGVREEQPPAGAKAETETAPRAQR
jgi:hypothetical protein